MPSSAHFVRHFPISSYCNNQTRTSKLLPQSTTIIQLAKKKKKKKKTDKNRKGKARTHAQGKMAVQAQYPSNAFSPHGLPKPPLNGAGASCLLLDHHQIGGYHPFGASYASPLGAPQQILMNGVTVFSEPESELTCNASCSRKRKSRDDDVDRPVVVVPSLPQPTGAAQNHQMLRFGNLPYTSSKVVAPAAKLAGVGCPAAISTGLELSHEDSRRLNESATTSTSGRTSATPTPLISPLAKNLVSNFHHQSLEVDALIRLQNEKLRSALEEARKRRYRALLSAVEQQVMRRLREKDEELESANRQNAELEDKVRQMSAENQVWFNVARNNEAIVSSLRANLEQVLLQNAAGGAAAAAQPREGYGNSDGYSAALFPADDAQSCCFMDEEGARERREAEAEETKRENQVLRRRRACKVCLEREVSVLLLPCRHLCLCKDCESQLDTCPICKSAKNASLQIFMS